jgi:hypothetical protein
MKVSELLKQAKELWLTWGKIDFHGALREVTDNQGLRSDAHMYLGRAYFTEEETITRAITLAAIDEAGLGDLLRGKELEEVEDPPEGPETY